MDFSTPGYCSWKSYNQSALEMPGEFVESKIKYYKMRKEVYAKGGGGEIHIGIDPVSNSLVAIKKGYTKDRPKHGVSTTFIREIGILKELSIHHHCNIVDLIDVFPSDGDVYIVEKFYPSYIQQYLDREQSVFSEEQIKYILFSVIQALLFLKKCKLIHGDIKPANFLVSNDNRIALTDFGSARRCKTEGCCYTNTSCVSTTYYNAPEILLGLHRLTYAVDVWSFAVTWLQLVGVEICEREIKESKMCKNLFKFVNESVSVETWPDLSDLQMPPTYEKEPSLPLFDRLRPQIPVSKCSDDGLTLLCSMFRLNPDNRPSIEEISQDSYFSDCIYHDVMNGSIEKSSILPKLSVLEKKSVLPTIVSDYFHNHLNEESRENDNGSESSPYFCRRALHFDNDNSLSSPQNTNDRVSVCDISFSCDESSILL